MKKIFFYVLVQFLLFSFNWVFAQEILVDAEHRGTVQIRAGISIFPEKRLNNAIYKSGAYLFGSENIAITDMLELTEGVLLQGKNAEGENALLFKGGEIPEQEIYIPGPGYLWLKKPNGAQIFRINLDNQIERVLGQYRSLGKPVYNGINAIATYHVESSEKIGEKEVYRLKIHFVTNEAPQVTTLNPVIENSEPFLKLSWQGREIKYILKDETGRNLIVQ